MLHTHNFFHDFKIDNVFKLSVLLFQLASMVLAHIRQSWDLAMPQERN